MGFSIIRFFFVAVLLALCFCIINRVATRNIRRDRIFAVAIASLLFIVLSLIPVENAWVTFATPEKAYAYIGRGDVCLVVPGTDVDFVVAEIDKNEYRIKMLPKTENGWKISTSLVVPQIHKIAGGCSIRVYQYKNSDEYFLHILSAQAGNNDVHDNRNSDFYRLTRESASSGDIYEDYFCFIHALDDQYRLQINGTEVQFNDTLQIE